MKYDLSILVPVYNEEASLPTLLARLGAIKLQKKAQLIIVNDGSKDNSENIIKDWLRSKSLPFDIEFINHKKNKGKGAGIQTGLSKAVGKYFVIQDADLEYDPAEIPSIIDTALLTDAPVIYGSRFLGSIDTMPKANYYANRFYNILIRTLYPGVKITDMHTCYKMIRTDIFKGLHIHSQGFGYAPEVISKLLRNGVRIVEVPITFQGRTVKEGKKINVRDGVECLLQILKYRFQSKEKLFEERD